MGRHRKSQSQPSKSLESRLADSERRLEEFARAVSHDLRTPLSTIVMQAQMLRRRPEEGALQRADAILSNAQRLNTMIQDLVDLTRAQAGLLRLHRTELSPAAILEEASLRLGALAQRVRIQPASDRCLLHVDRDRLARVLGHFVSSAARYWEGALLVWAEQGAADVAFCVGPVETAEPRAPAALEGEGQPETELGMRVSIALIRLHGGKIIRTQLPESGRLALSFSVPISSAVRRTAPGPQAGSNKRVLVLEPDLNLRELLCLALEDEGFVALGVSDCASARAHARTPLHLAILDVERPTSELSGLVATLREGAVGAVPVIGVGPRPRAAPGTQGVSADLYLEKPLELPRLLEESRRLCQEG